MRSEMIVRVYATKESDGIRSIHPEQWAQSNLRKAHRRGGWGPGDPHSNGKNVIV